jgi:hypothetical protein
MFDSCLSRDNDKLIIIVFGLFRFSYCFSFLFYRSRQILKKLKPSKTNVRITNETMTDKFSSRFLSRHTASRTEQEAKGHLERQKIADEAEGMYVE